MWTTESSYKLDTQHDNIKVIKILQIKFKKKLKNSQRQYEWGDQFELRHVYCSLLSCLEP